MSEFIVFQFLASCFSKEKEFNWD